MKFQSSKGKEKKILLTCPITSVDIRKGKKAREIHVAGLSCLWDTGASNSMVKKSFVRKFREKFRKINKNMILPAARIHPTMM